MRNLLALIISIVCFYTVHSQENVLLIISDDVGIDMTKGYNSPLDVPPTPNIDQLAKNGITFQNVWSNPLCSPTRSTILTGRFGFRTGVGAPVGKDGRPGPSADEYMLPMAIRQNSKYQYQTACIGKWHLSDYSNGGDDHPNLAGFNYFSGIMEGGLLNYYSWNKIVNGEEYEVSNYATTENVDDAIRWLNQQTDQWFLVISFNAAHTPFQKPPDSLHTYKNLPDTIINNKEGGDTYKAMIQAMDTEMGRLFEYMKSTNQYQKTNIIYLGDNGTLGQVIESPYLTSQGKGTMYEGGVHVPMIISGPSVVSPGRDSYALVSTVDLFNTILELCGASAIEKNLNDLVIDSRSFFDVLQNTAQEHRDWLYSEKFETGNYHTYAARDEQYHLIVNQDGSHEFFDIENDKFELSDLLQASLTAEQQLAYTILSGNINTLLGTETSENETSKKGQILNDQYLIYPNPARNNVSIKLSSIVSKDVRISLCSIQGKMIKQIYNGTIYSENYILNFSIRDIPLGIYIIKIQTEDSEWAGLLLKTE